MSVFDNMLVNHASQEGTTLALGGRGLSEGDKIQVKIGAGWVGVRVKSSGNRVVEVDIGGHQRFTRTEWLGYSDDRKLVIRLEPGMPAYRPNDGAFIELPEEEKGGTCELCFEGCHGTNEAMTPFQGFMIKGCGRCVLIRAIEILAHLE